MYCCVFAPVRLELLRRLLQPRVRSSHGNLVLCSFCSSAGVPGTLLLVVTETGDRQELSMGLASGPQEDDHPLLGRDWAPQQPGAAQLLASLPSCCSGYCAFSPASGHLWVPVTFQILRSEHQGSRGEATAPAPLVPMLCLGVGVEGGQRCTHTVAIQGDGGCWKTVHPGHWGAGWNRTGGQGSFAEEGLVSKQDFGSQGLEE